MKSPKKVPAAAFTLAILVGAIAYIGCTPKTDTKGTETTGGTTASKDNGGKDIPLSGKKYLLRIKETPGAKWSYTYKVATFVDPKDVSPENKKKMGVPEYGSAEVEGVVNMEVKSAKDGKTTYLKTGTRTSSKGTGIWKAQADEPIKPDAPTTFTWDDRMNNVNIAKEEGLADPLTNTFNAMFPKEEVQVGSKWEYKPYPTTQDVAKAQVVAMETIHGKETMKIELTLPGNPGDTNVMTAWIDVVTGRYLKVDLLSKSNLDGLKSENHMVQEIKD